MSSQRARRTHPARDPHLDHGAAGAAVEQTRRGKGSLRGGCRVRDRSPSGRLGEPAPEKILS
jgi:hypothetical protein